mmetsp:Transcript_17166/g.29553  ORF Transcript_17166/g.29553 Transcript_17166/m.29553 type:complete len:334 (+) Transcript_17166:605-1606(+)|eukprot:CAMPEP_0183774982 /NCGR_PEP_ID=MMETSP0739-20130205/43352_1 /TAXON_ID=385413 /ORGANISM="Thalassiosira miniscula, Strain CCMP1093" /LENGTH=333 /DNA_ID=CAMNT_0026016463 /DNA_START=544 /DNA_END=1545 /DNA_ORIENTATION=-
MFGVSMKKNFPLSLYLFTFLFLGALQFPARKIRLRFSASNIHTNAQENHAWDKNHNSSNTPNQGNDALPLVYTNDRDKFTEIFASCMLDPTCHILYNHLQKTGGSHLASRLHPILDEAGKKYDSKKWCCDQGLMTRFHNRTRHYCELKFGIYETNVPMFTNVVETCQRYTSKRSREIALITIRDPIERTISQIHHRCNKGYKNRAEKQKKICQRCSYTDDPEFYNHYVNQTNDLYLGLTDTMPELTRILEEVNSKKEFDHQEKLSGLLVLENSDINSFLAHVEQLTNVTFPKGRVNYGNTKVCNFEAPSTMRGKLQPSMDVYQSIVSIKEDEM